MVWSTHFVTAASGNQETVPIARPHKFWGNSPLMCGGEERLELKLSYLIIFEIAYKQLHERVGRPLSQS